MMSEASASYSMESTGAKNPTAVSSKPADIRRARIPNNLLQSEIAVNRMMEYITNIPDPDLLLEKAGVRRHHLRQLELDDEVAQAMDTRREAVISTPWRLSSNSVRSTRWIHEVIEPHIEQLMRGALDARFYGYSVQEIIFENVDSGIGVQRLSTKPMEWFQPMRDGSLRYLPNDGTGGVEGFECSPYKFLLTRCNETYANPYGEALLSRIWFPVTNRREGWGLWLQFLESFGTPIVVGLVRNYKEFCEAMQEQGIRSAVAFDSIDSDESIKTINASTPGEFERLERAILRRIQKLILGQTLTSDIGSSGSYAAAAIHNEVRNDKRRADLRLVSRTAQRLIDIVCAINGIKEVPRFIMEDDTGLETSRAQRDSILSPVLQTSGFTFKKQYFVDHYDINDGDIVESNTMNNNVHNNTIHDVGITNDAPVKNQSVVD